MAAAQIKSRIPMTDRQTWVKALDEIGPHARPADDLMSRAELLQILRSQGIPLTKRSLQEWERIGVLPSAVIQKYGGRPQATYPRWWDSLVIEVFQNIKLGTSRDHAKDIARSWLFYPVSHRDRSAFFDHTHFMEIDRMVREVIENAEERGIPQVGRISEVHMNFVDNTGKTVFSGVFQIDPSDSHEGM